MDRGTRQRLAGLTVALVLVTPLSVVAARWQWSRHLERDALNAAVVAAERTPPMPLQRAFAGRAPDARDEWRRVIAIGTWEPEQQLLVRKSVVQGEVGFSVLTPFITSTGTRLWVLRGWVQRSSSAIPAPPTGEQQVLLRVRMPYGEGDIRPSDLPPGQINWVDPQQLATLASAAQADGQVRRSWHAVFELLDPVPSGLVALPWPELTSGPHVSYFVQWILIGLTGIVVYVRVFRSELRLQRDDDASTGV